MDIIFKLNSPDHGLYGPGSVQTNSIHPAQMRDGSVTCQSIRLDAHNRKKTNLNKKRKVIDECDNQRWTIIRVRTIFRIIPGIFGFRIVIFSGTFGHFLKSFVMKHTVIGNLGHCDDSFTDTFAIGCSS